MAKPTLDLDLLVRGTRAAEESADRPFYVITFGSITDLRTQDRGAAQTMMMGLVGFDEVTVTLKTFASLEELDYAERFEKKSYEDKKAFENDWRRWMDYEKREEAREMRERTARDMALLTAAPPSAPEPPADRTKGDDVPF
jgi:hypothetical protein